MRISYFIDTSALFKRYVNEKGSSAVDRIFSDNNNKYISSLTIVEVISNLRRLVDVNKILNEEEFKIVAGTFLKDVKTGTIQVVEVKTPVILKSMDLCAKRHITPMDALQLAAVLENPEELIFVCSDKRLLSLAKEEGVDTLNPEESQ